MLYGLQRPRALPRQNTKLVLLMWERFWRAAQAHETWAKEAKKCVEYVEGKQWAAADLAIMEKGRRPALTLNKLRPIVFLVLGYHANHRTDIRYLPGNDGTGSAEQAHALSHVSKQISEVNQLPYVSSEVFMDGILGGRGYYDCRLDFRSNLLGEVAWSAIDPFSVYLDPQGDTYDLNQSCTYVIRSRWVSVDEVEFFYGQQASRMVRPLVQDGYSMGSMPSDASWGTEEIHPWRRFGGEQDEFSAWGTFGTQFYDWVDTARKCVRLIDVEHYVSGRWWHFVDLQTGDMKMVPDHWDKDKVQRVLDWSKANGQPVVAMQIPTKRLRWTHQIADTIVYDEWSPYKTFTAVPYFPYFRRGQTRGMVHDLLGPQDEINKRRSARLSIINRTANSGWIHEKNVFDAQGRQNIERWGSAPGVNISWDSKRGTLPEPKQIQPAAPPIAHQQLEQDAEGDLNDISGVNKAALGQWDKVESGVALEARQRQAVIGIEPFMVNYSRSQELAGRKQLELIQDHYTEERLIRAIGADRKPETIVINQRTVEGILNNVTFGRYSISIDESPLAKSFLQGQFHELMQLKETGMPIPDDFLVDASSIGRKEELKTSLAEQREMERQMAMAGIDMKLEGPGPGGSRVGPDGGSLPRGEPGGPPA